MTKAFRPDRPARNSGWRIFRWPLAIGVASVVGLVAALVGDGWYDGLSWAMLGGACVLMGVLLAV